MENKKNQLIRKYRNVNQNLFLFLKTLPLNRCFQYHNYCGRLAVRCLKQQQSLSLFQFWNDCFWRQANWLITACKTYSNEAILSLESTWIEYLVWEQSQSKGSGDKNKMNPFIGLIKEKGHCDFLSVY